MIKNKKEQILESIIIIISGILGLYFHIKPNKWYVFTYYTVLSNCLVLIFFSYHLYLLYKDRAEIINSKTYTRLKAGVTATILLTFFTYVILLLPRQSRVDFFRVKNITLHLIVPILTIANWKKYDIRGMYRVFEPLRWTVLPILYLIYALIRGLVFNIPIPENEDSPFPYFFLNVYEMGIPKVVMYCILLLLIFITLSYLMCLLKKEKKQKSE